MFKNINLKKGGYFYHNSFYITFYLFDKIYVSYEPKKLVENINYSKIVLDRNGEILSVFLNKDEEFHLKYEGDIPETLKLAVFKLRR